MRGEQVATDSNVLVMEQRVALHNVISNRLKAGLYDMEYGSR